MTSPTPGTDFWDWDESKLLLVPKPHPAIQQAEEPPSAPRLMIVGAAISNGGGTNTSSITITLTTKRGASNNVIVVAYTTNSGSGTIKSISGAGINNFRPYGATYFAPGTTNQLWWGVAPNSLTAATITLTLNSNTNNISGGVAVAFAINGCNTVWPWDNNINSTITSSTPSATVNSTLKDDLMLIIPAAFGSGPGTPATGFQTVGTKQSGNCTVSIATQLWSNVVTNKTLTWTGLTNGGARFVALTANTSLEPLYTEVNDYPSIPKTTIYPFHRLVQFGDPDEGWPQGSQPLQPLPYPARNIPRSLRIR